MRIGWYVTQRGNGPQPWVLEKKLWNHQTIEYRRESSGNVARWAYREAAQEVADRINREEAVS